MFFQDGGQLEKFENLFQATGLSKFRYLSAFLDFQSLVGSTVEVLWFTVLFMMVCHIPAR